MRIQVADLQRLLPVHLLVLHRDHVVLQVAGQRAWVLLDAYLHLEVIILVRGWLDNSVERIRRIVRQRLLD